MVLDLYILENDPSVFAELLESSVKSRECSATEQCRPERTKGVQLQVDRVPGSSAATTAILWTTIPCILPKYFAYSVRNRGDSDNNAGLAIM